MLVGHKNTQNTQIKLFRFGPTLYSVKAWFQYPWNQEERGKTAIHNWVLALSFLFIFSFSQTAATENFKCSRHWLSKHFPYRTSFNLILIFVRQAHFCPFFFKGKRTAGKKSTLPCPSTHSQSQDWLTETKTRGYLMQHHHCTETHFHTDSHPNTANKRQVAYQNTF